MNRKRLLTSFFIVCLCGIALFGANLIDASFLFSDVETKIITVDPAPEPIEYTEIQVELLSKEEIEEINKK